MITGELKSKVDRIWDAFWSGGISNPIEVIEQITFLLFIRRFDELQTLAENRARRLKEPVIDPTFLPGRDQLRWSRFKSDSGNWRALDRLRKLDHVKMTQAPAFRGEL